MTGITTDNKNERSDADETWRMITRVTDKRGGSMVFEGNGCNVRLKFGSKPFSSKTS